MMTLNAEIKRIFGKSFLKDFTSPASNRAQFKN